MIDPGVILMWAGTNASIPSGWQRETSLDSRYVKGWGDQDPNISDGKNTHTHSDGGHTHTMKSHSHTYKLDTIGDEILAQNYVEGYETLVASHLHEEVSTESTSGGSLQSETVTWSSANHEPPYYEVIYIKPNDNSMADIADGVISLFSDDSVPSGWNYCDGANGTSNLTNRFLKGASQGADPASPDGSTSHAHSVTHGHSSNSHNHSGTSGRNNDDHGTRQGWSGDNNYANSPHYHEVTLSSETASVDDYANSNVGSGDTVEPEHITLGAIEATSSATVTNGLVALWLGSTGSLPDGWVVCDGSNGTYNLQNQYIKIGNDLTENGDPGGTNTHNHSSISHSHSASSAHDHSGGSMTGSSKCYQRSSGSEGVVACSHTHSFNYIDSATASYNSNNITCTTVNNEPAYLTAVYIEFQGKLLLGGMI